MSNRHKAALQSAVAAAVVAGFIAKQSGAEDKEVAAAALIAGLIAYLVAYKLAQGLEEERKKLEGKENDLDARIAYARSVNTQTRQYNEELTANINKIETSVQEGTVKKQDLTRIQNNLNKDIKGVNTALTELKEYRETLVSQKHPQPKIDDLDMQIQEMQAHLESIEDNARKLAQLKKRIKV